MILALATAGAKLALAIVDRIPDPDPELRRMRAEHRNELAVMREWHRQERWRARMARRRERRAAR